MRTKNTKENKMNRSESIKNIAKAMSEFQAKVKQPEKSADNPYFNSKYVPLEQVVDAITETAKEHGLSFTQWAENLENRVGVGTLLMHESGEFIEYPPIFMKTDKDTAQGIGSVITYARRYSLSAIFGITSDIDDDGNEASGNTKTKQPEQKKQNKQAQTKTKEQVESAYKQLVQITNDTTTFDDFYNKQSAQYSNEQIIYFINRKMENEKKKHEQNPDTKE